MRRTQAGEWLSKEGERWAVMSRLVSGMMQAMLRAVVAHNKRHQRRAARMRHRCDASRQGRQGGGVRDSRNSPRGRWHCLGSRQRYLWAI